MLRGMKVARIARRVQRGSYQVDAAKVADALMLRLCRDEGVAVEEIAALFEEEELG